MVPPVVGWSPTHRVPDAGLAAWEQPDPAAPSARNLPAGTAVQLVEANGAWARVVMQHGREWWVDGRALEQLVFTDQKSNAVLDVIAGPGKDMLAVVAVLAVTMAISHLLAPLLALPGNALKDAIPRGDCTGEIAGTSAMYVCSVKVGFMTVLGPVLVLVTGLVFRRPLMRQVRKLTLKLPRNSSMFVTPALATAMFTMVYASVHSQTSGQNGLVPQRMFPALLGLLTFLAARLRGTVARRFGGAIAARDRIPGLVRAVLAVGLPMVVAYVIMRQDRVTETAAKEQIVALLTVFLSYSALVPRDGDFLGAAERLLMGKGMSRLRRSVPGSQYVPPGVIPPP
jgi:hypothetical protein